MAASRVETFRAMVESDPGNALARYGLANELVKAELYEEGIKALQEYLSMNEDEGAAYRMLGFANEKLEKFAEAREAYRQGIQAANKHHHPGMAGEYEMKLQDIEDL
jgi:predicted Zn-dependent protease